jgi:4-hydroxy-3-methylbut-2-enyl diphosphate reductase
MPKKIFIAKYAGFCEGVERAYRIALENAEKNQTVFMLGNLVHNSQVVEKFKSLGVKMVKDISEISPSPPTPAPTPSSRRILIIPAHGVAPEIYDQAKQLGLEIADTTCPWVKKAQKIAHDLALAGRRVLIVGDRGHPEVKGLLGWSQDKGIVIENVVDLQNLKLSPDAAVGILAQTTQSKEHFNNMVEALKNSVRNCRAFDTICTATAKRQAAATQIAQKVEVMLVIGDRMSANSKRLTELCQQSGTPTYQIQSAVEMNPAWLEGKNRIGITAGASTPDWIIKAVLDKIQ